MGFKSREIRSIRSTKIKRRRERDAGNRLGGVAAKKACR
jgi:hypothetical protein